MSGEDDPDYLKGVEQPGFGDRDNFTVKTSQDGPLNRSAFKKPVDDDDDEDDDVDERPSFRFPWPLLLLAVVVVGALGTLFAAGVAATGTWVDDAERAALVEAGNLSRVVEEERKILDELGSRGANRSELMQLYTQVDEAEGHQRGLAALAFTRRVDTEVANIGDIRGSAVEDRHKKLAIAQQRYEAALGGWTSAAGNPIGAIAVTVGLAEAPPPH